MRTVLNASDGHILTDGEIYGKTLYLADGSNVSKFYEITEEEYEAITSSEAAGAEDYKSALERFGVK